MNQPKCPNCEKKISGVEQTTFKIYIWNSKYNDYEEEISVVKNSLCCNCKVSLKDLHPFSIDLGLGLGLE